MSAESKGGKSNQNTEPTAVRWFARVMLSIGVVVFALSLFAAFTDAPSFPGRWSQPTFWYQEIAAGALYMAASAYLFFKSSRKEPIQPPETTRGK
jgi:hypothetical protein